MDGTFKINIDPDRDGRLSGRSINLEELSIISLDISIIYVDTEEVVATYYWVTGNRQLESQHMKYQSAVKSE